MHDTEHIVKSSNLPFNPVRGQVIYVDSDNNKRINSFIVSNYDWLRSMYQEKGLDFCYLPLLGDELISYHAPYLNGKQRQDLLQSVPSIANLIEAQTPSLLYALDDEEDGEMRLMPIETRWYSKLKKVFTTLADSIRRDLASHYPTRRHEDVVSEPTIRFSLSEDSSDIRFSLSLDSPNIEQSEGVAKEPDVRYSLKRREVSADDLFGTES